MLLLVVLLASASARALEGVALRDAEMAEMMPSGRERQVILVGLGGGCIYFFIRKKNQRKRQIWEYEIRTATTLFLTNHTIMLNIVESVPSTRSRTRPE